MVLAKFCVKIFPHSAGVGAAATYCGFLFMVKMRPNGQIASIFSQMRDKALTSCEYSVQ
jgi:hypothetical protein